MYFLFVVCHYVQCRLQQYFDCVITSYCTVCCSVSQCPLLYSKHSAVLSVPRAVLPVGFVSLCPLLSSTVCPLLYSTLCLPPVSINVPSIGSVLLCPLLSSAVYPLLFSTACPLSARPNTPSLVSVHCTFCCLLQYVLCMSVPHTVPSVGSVSPCPPLSSTTWPLSVSTSQYTDCCFYGTVSTVVFHILSTSVCTSHCTVCWFCVTVSTAIFYNLATFRQYLTMYRLFVLYHYVHCCFPHSLHVCLYLTFYRLFVLCVYVHCFSLHYVQFRSVRDIDPSVFSVSMYPLLFP